MSEPYRIPPRNDWVGDADSSVALVFGPKVKPPSSRGTTRGQGYVAVGLGALTIVGVYFSPNRPLVEFETLLVRLTTIIGGATSPVIVAGDFNAKSSLWGSSATDARGRAVEEWLTSSGLVLANRGSASTCVRRQGESIVDLTFVSATIARRVNNWRVLEETETLSDHRYICFDVSARASEMGHTIPSGGSPRWSVKRLDRGLLQEAAVVASWAPLPSDDVNECAEWLKQAMYGVCDASMPRVGPSTARRQTYWWRPELRHLQNECTVARRRYKRYRRRHIRDQQEEEALYDAYRAACLTLSNAIVQAKTDAWEQWLRCLEDDPWGKPYKWVRQKLRPSAPPITQCLQPELRGRVVSTLFPSGTGPGPAPVAAHREETSDDEDEIPPVTSAELALAVHRMGLKNTAPGPDGIPGRAWVLAMKEMEPRVLSVLTNCLVQGRVPRSWKAGKLVLLRKAGRPEEQPSAYRPIVLLDEVCKMLERVVVARLVKHLEGVGPDLSENQYGFRAGRSTIGAIARLRDIAEEEVSQGGVVLAVSLDISNAFNSLPWATIKDGLRHHGVPRYLRNTISGYLSERSVQYPTQEGWEEKVVECGVPQGSALGPSLWNIGFDPVLRGANLRGAEVVCYADDTNVICRGRTYREVVILATAAVAQVVRRIRGLGLTVALEKSEALCFHGPRNAPRSDLVVVVGGTRIKVTKSMTYLGLVLDGRWSFEEHFLRLTKKVTKSAGALASLLPNLGGPSLTCRRLYMGIIRSMVMYGAPIWAEHLSPKNRLALARIQRVMATRAVRGYRTISMDAACLLAGTIPWDLDAQVLADAFWRCEAARAEGGCAPPEGVRIRWRAEGRDRAIALWAGRLQEPRSSANLVQAIRPVFQEWLARKHGALSFRLTQVLTGHGCFGRYLCEITNREDTTRCHHCDDDRDTAEHTVSACPAWTRQRAALEAAIGYDLSLPAIVKAMVGSEQDWRAVEHFAEEVISAKEEAERMREREALDPRRRPRRRRRAGLNADTNVPP